MNANKVLIKACLNGARPAGSHPALPVTPDEVARAVAAARDAGAGAVHFHPRGPSGAESLDAADVGAVVDAVRAACPGLPAGVTTGAWIERDPAKRLELINAWKVLPDFASVNWREDGAPELAARLIDMGVAVEVGLFTLDDAKAFAAGKVAPYCLRALIEVRGADGIDAVDLAWSMDEALGAAGLTIPRLHHGFADDTWRVVGRALEKGRDVRIGLEDTFTLADGRQARDNAELVAAVATMARGAGRTI
ncbi:MAG TPA: 3-keto-5-aminohexanoate cleavage protein [Dehalococcoidia bacterium]|jgi:uncharacterized protein (DUF849 family)